MDADNDGLISRREWRGSAQSFNVHDWNNDGVLSGEEVRPGGVRSRRLEEDDYLIGGRNATPAWTDAEFRSLDRNNDRRIARSEWFYDPDTFYRTDRNGDGVLTSAEFFAPDDGDRNDSFEYLDVNNSNRVERTEWHGTAGEFSRLDRNRDNALTRAELLGGTTAAPSTADLFNTLDADDDERISSIEWRWSLRSFDRADVNNDGFLSRDEFTGRPGTGLGTMGR
jgi:Ca2+-binding EF-hand superfamily protein